MDDKENDIALPSNKQPHATRDSLEIHSLGLNLGTISHGLLAPGGIWVQVAQCEKPWDYKSWSISSWGHMGAGGSV